MTGFVDNNEGLICDAVIRFFVEHTGYNHTTFRCPVLEGRAGAVILLIKKYS